MGIPTLRRPPMRVNEQPPTPQQHGAVGDGVADDTAALNAWAAAGYSEGYVPPGTYLTSTGVVQPVTMSVELSRGARIKATGPMPFLWGTPPPPANPKEKWLVGGIFDCNNLAQVGINLPYFHLFYLMDCRIERSAGHSLVVGDPTATDPAGGLNAQRVDIWRGPGETAPAGSYGIWVRRAYDSHFNNCFVVGAQAASVRADVGANFFTEVHAWGYAGAVPDVCFDDNADNNTWISCMADTPGTYGFRLRQFYTELISCHSYMNNTWGTDNVATGIYMDKTGSNSVITGHYFEGEDATHRFAADVEVAGQGSYFEYVSILGTRTKNITSVRTTHNVLAGDLTVRAYGTFGAKMMGSSTQLLHARTASGTQVFNINTATAGAPTAVWPNKIQHTGYSDNYTTATWRIDSNTGGMRAGSPAGMGATTYSGSGAPTIAGTAGDRYMRTDTPTVANQREYICTVTGAAGVATWVGII